MHQSVYIFGVNFDCFDRGYETYTIRFKTPDFGIEQAKRLANEIRDGYCVHKPNVVVEEINEVSRQGGIIIYQTT